MIEGKYQSQPPLPFSFGGEIAGVVSAVGSAVTGITVGDRVFAGCGHGGMREQLCVPAKLLRPA